VIAPAVYFLCALTSALCAVALIREYARRHTRLLLWSSLAFVCFAASNALVFADFVLLPAVDLSVVRVGTACLGVALLLFGLVWDTE
jgi:hypothetical protein